MIEPLTDIADTGIRHLALGQNWLITGSVNPNTPPSRACPVLAHIRAISVRCTPSQLLSAAHAHFHSPSIPNRSLYTS